MPPVLVQPAPLGRVSGGYLYNAQMAAHGAWQLLDLQAPELPAAVEALSSELVIADSIWLTEQAITPFLRLSERGTRVAVMMHSFPSMITVAESGRGVQLRPTRFEVETLERLGTMLVPGPHYARMLGDARVDTRVLPPGIDPGFRAAPRARTGPCQLVSIGAVTPRKGFLDLAEVLAQRNRHDDYRWMVIGDLTIDAAYAQAVCQRVSSFGSVTFLSKKSPRETAELLKQSHLLIMPSYDENHPLILLEAIAAGVPSVAYAAGAAADILGQGQAGIVCPIGDKGSLLAALESLISDEPARFALAQGAAALGQALPSWPEAGAHARRQLGF
jgi:glycosyltransferase involved in cell wall biosynthesis